MLNFLKRKFCAGEDLYFLTWGLDIEHGGMTIAMLNRAKAITSKYKVAVTILTLSQDVDIEEKFKKIKERYQLGNNVHLKNLWIDYSKYVEFDEGFSSSNCIPKAFTKLDVLSQDDLYTFYGIEGQKVGYTLRNKKTGVEGYGALKNLECVGLKKGGKIWGKSGQTIVSWKGHWQLYRKWFDDIFRDIYSILIVDSKTAADCLVSYKKNNLKKIYMVHGSHLYEGKFEERRKYAMSDGDNFDAFVFLTNKQKNDYISLVGNKDNCHVVHNFIEPTKRNIKPRPLNTAVMVARLDEDKQIDHAILALSLLKNKYDLSIALDIYGDGELKEELIELTKKLNLSDEIVFKGYSENVREKLSNYSFMLFTSKAEGFGMVLVEGMEKGCIPISYDLDYGPSEIISNGIDGYLIDKNPTAMAEILRHLIIDRSQKDIHDMRKKAARSIDKYSMGKIAKYWRNVCS
ncbi:glycosyltransferase [Cobetia marina]|uniref:glycosyltransferase n=1 Tax=Cobetia marina TaxID=28258 RepID=UPI0026E2C6D4|nr:glycosyltransferase [Cobetia marina]MDO6786209.1 glycosyltransferase [Cobetia marina]